MRFDPKTERVIITEMAGKLTRGLSIDFSNSSNLHWTNIVGSNYSNPINQGGELVSLGVRFLNPDQSEPDLNNPLIRNGLSTARNRINLELGIGSSSDYTMPLSQVMPPIMRLQEPTTEGAFDPGAENRVLPPSIPYYEKGTALGESAEGKYNKEFEVSFVLSSQGTNQYLRTAPVQSDMTCPDAVIDMAVVVTQLWIVKKR